MPEADFTCFSQRRCYNTNHRHTAMRATEYPYPPDRESRRSAESGSRTGDGERQRRSGGGDACGQSQRAETGTERMPHGIECGWHHEGSSCSRPAVSGTGAFIFCGRLSTKRLIFVDKVVLSLSAQGLPPARILTGNQPPHSSSQYQTQHPRTG